MAQAQILGPIFQKPTAVAPSATYYGYSNTTMTGVSSAPAASVHGATAQGLADYAIATMVTMGANSGGYAVDKCAASVSNSDGVAAHNMQCAVYGDLTVGCDASAAHCPDVNPGALCYTSSASIAAGASAAWVEATPASCPVLTANAIYWVVVEYDNASLNYYNDATTPYSFFWVPNFGSWGTQATTASQTTNAYSMYVKVTAN